MRSTYFPFHQLGLRANPFRALEDDEWAAIAVLPEAALRAAGEGWHLQVLGERGRGKTTTLLGLQARLRQAGQRTDYEYVPDGQTAFQAVPAGLDVFLLDEAQRLAGGERNRLLGAARAGRRLMLGSHEDFTPMFAAAGLRLATLRLEGEGPAHLEAVLVRRVAFFALTPEAPGVTFEPGAVDYLHVQFGSDLRASERFLYEVFQALTRPSPISAEQLRQLAID